MLAVIFINRMISRRRNACKMANEIKKETKSTDMEHCRTCLCTVNLVALFSTKESDRKRSKDLLAITGLKIKANDGLSQKICEKCMKSLDVAIKFRKMSRKTYKSLITVTSAVKIKPQYTANVLDPEPDIEKAPETKTEGLGDDDYMGEVFGDDFQNDHNEKESDQIKEELEIKPKKMKQKSVKSAAEKKQRVEIPNASSYKCSWCSKEFRMKATFKAHMRFHTNYCVCEACGKRCRNNNQLQEHKRARHGLGKIHKCAYCEYSSATKEALTIHERRHTGERPYICDHCGATFHRRSNLVQHIAIHLPEKNFQCDLCPKRLQSRKLLQIHKHNAHTGKRYGYLCAVCAHRFEKPNKCSICLVWQKSHKRLQIHKSKVHRTKRYRYVCPVCRSSFARPGNVRRHLVRAHGVARRDQGAIDKVYTITAASEHIFEKTEVKSTS